MNGKTALESKTIRFNVALGAISATTLLSYILNILMSDNFLGSLMILLNELGISADAALVSSIVGLVVSIIGVYLRIVTTEGIVSLK